MISYGFDSFYEFIDGFGQISDTFATVFDSIRQVLAV